MMKTLKSYNVLKYVAISCIFSVLAITSCHEAKGYDAKDSDMEETRPDADLSKLMHSITDGDATTFASFCSYPIIRRYPLRSIDDSTTMVDYFPIIADNNLRIRINNYGLNDWKFNGWRGWSLGDSTIFWYDDGLQFIDYESTAEAGLRKILAKEEIMSLLPELRGEWTPVTTLIEEDGDRIFRIDADGESYRLMGYDHKENMRGKPSFVMTGSAKTEGSAGLVSYLFADSIGCKAEYSPDMEPPTKIIMTFASGQPLEYIVNPGYWRDHLK